MEILVVRLHQPADRGSGMLERGIAVAAGERDLGERGVRLGSPPRMAGQVTAELGGLARGAFGGLEECVVIAFGAQTGGGERELGEGLAAAGGLTAFGGELDRPFEVLDRLIGVAGA